MREKNVEKKEGFCQVCVWPGTIVEEGKEREFEDFMLKELGTRVRFLETILTKPDKRKDGTDDPDTGGRADVFFAVHDEDVGKFAVPRLGYGIRWIEDALAKCNHTAHLYPSRVKKYKIW
jgi:hypothetical protein